MRANSKFILHNKNNLLNKPMRIFCNQKKIGYVGIACLACLLLVNFSVFAQQGLEYQKRAHRYEGIRPKPVSGFDIELLSAHIAFHDDIQQLAEHYQVRFYLNEVQPVYLVVREIDYRHFYWLDKVEPDIPWQKGFSNVYRWPTEDVIRHLNRLKLYDLGVVARLGNPEPKAEEFIAPVLLYQSHYPLTVSGYTFIFRLRDAANVQGKIYPQFNSKSIWEQQLDIQPGDRPFAISWDLAGRSIPSGYYKLVIEGYKVQNNDPIRQIVHFYHQPQVH